MTHHVASSCTALGRDSEDPGEAHRAAIEGTREGRARAQAEIHRTGVSQLAGLGVCNFKSSPDDSNVDQYAENHGDEIT